MELFTLQEAAGELRMSLSTLRRHVANGNIGYLILGHGRVRNHIRFRRDDLDAFLAQQQRRRERVEPPPPAPQARIDDKMDRWVQAEVQRIFSRPLPKRRVRKHR